MAIDRTVIRSFRIFLFLIFLVATIAFLVSIGDLVQLLVISALFAYVMDPLVSRIEARGVPRTIAILALFAIVGIAAISFLVGMVPVIRGELQAIQAGFSSEQTGLLIERFENYCREQLPFLNLEELDVANRIAETVLSSINRLFQNILEVFSLITNIVILPFIIFFLLKDGRELKRQFLNLIPNRYFEFTLNLLHKVDLQLGNYLRGMIMDGAIIGVLSTVALLILDVRYAFIIGAFAGVANLVPYLGPITGALVAIVITVVESNDPVMVLSIAIAFGIVQLIDNAIVQPTILSRSVNLPPMIILLGVVIGGKYFGILGMLLSVPVISILKVSLKESMQIYRRYRFA